MAKLPLQRFVKGQSPNDTAASNAGHSMFFVARAIIVSMVFTIIGALAVLAKSVYAEEARPRATVVAIARARIMSGVQMSQSDDAVDATRRTSSTPKPRERPCPETEQSPCRLLVVDMP